MGELQADLGAGRAWAGLRGRRTGRCRIAGTATAAVPGAGTTADALQTLRAACKALPAAYSLLRMREHARRHQLPAAFAPLRPGERLAETYNLFVCTQASSRSLYGWISSRLARCASLFRCRKRRRTSCSTPADPCSFPSYSKEQAPYDPDWFYVRAGECECRLS